MTIAAAMIALGIRYSFTASWVKMRNVLPQRPFLTGLQMGDGRKEKVEATVISAKVRSCGMFFLPLIFVSLTSFLPPYT